MTLWTDIENARLEVTRLEAELAAARDHLEELMALAATGVDVSQWNGDVDWGQVATEHDFGIVRVSDGDIRDSLYGRGRVEGVRAAGLLLGTYHFGRVGNPETNDDRDGRTEAAMAVWHAKQHGWGKPGDLPLAYDFETLNGQSAEKAAVHVAEFVRGYRCICQHLPMIYTAPAIWAQVEPHLGDNGRALLAECPLWIAHWGVPEPSVPEPWQDYAIWQWTESGSSPGITGDVDLNRSSHAALEALRI